MKKYYKLLLAFLYTGTAVAEVTGFGVANWGMSRNDIIAAEGKPTSVFDFSIMYMDKAFMGKKATVWYRFEEGCTTLKNSECHFSGGSYNFVDSSKEFSDELEQTLTKKYGVPIEIKKEVKVSPADNSIQGEKSNEKTIYVRYDGKVKIVHTRVINLYDYTETLGSAGKQLHKAGSCIDAVAYDGPYYYQIELNKKKATERGL